MWCDVSAGRCEPKAVICVLGSRRGERPVNVLPTATALCATKPQVPQVPSVGSMFYHHYYLSAASATPLTNFIWPLILSVATRVAASQQKETVHRSAAAEQLSRKLLGLIVPPLMHHCTGHTASVFNCNRDYPVLPCALHMCIVHVHIVQHFLGQAMARPMA